MSIDRRGTIKLSFECVINISISSFLLLIANNRHYVIWIILLIIIALLGEGSR